jgi:hypothetical protein
MRKIAPIAGAAAVLLCACASEPASNDYPPTTAICLDGTQSYNPRREGACANHDGVARWVETAHRRRRGD